MRKGVKRHNFILMFFAVCWMAGLGLLLFAIEPPSASAMLKELTVPSVITEPLTEQDPVRQAVGAGEQAATALTQDPVSPVIPKQVAPSLPIQAPVKTLDDIAESETSAVEVPQLSIDTPAGRVQTPAVKADTNELHKGVRSLPVKVHTRSVKTPTVLNVLPSAVNQVRPETAISAFPAPSVLKQPQAAASPNSQAKISVSQVSRGNAHQRKQWNGLPRIPLNEKPSLFPTQAVSTPQVPTSSGGGSGGQASGPTSAGSASWWMAVSEPSLFGHSNEWSQKIAARYLLGFDQWCQPPPEEPPMEAFFSNF